LQIAIKINAVRSLLVEFVEYLCGSNGKALKGEERGKGELYLWLIKAI